MKSGNIIKRTILFSLIFFLLTGCTIDGLTKEELKRVNDGDATTKMTLFTINSQRDSILLRKEARKVSKKNITTLSMEKLKSRLLATVTDSMNLGVGIAAPQVGVSLKMIYVQRLDKKNAPFEVYYNPKIEFMADTINSGMEGCLSVPGYRGHVDRSQNIKISYTDSIGDKKSENISGFTAVIFQHEIDHLNGILYFDRISGGFKSLFPVKE